MRQVNDGRKRIDAGPPIYPGYQWGEPIDGSGTLDVKRDDETLTVTAAMPSYEKEDLPCDLIRQYEGARKDRSIGKQRTGKDSPHVRFANANTDDELIDFVRSFGPVVATTVKSTFHDSPGELQMRLTALQDLRELRNEQKVYKAAFHLVLELTREDQKYDRENTRRQIAEIANHIRAWPRQYWREKRARRAVHGAAPWWRITQESIQRITALAQAGADRFMSAQVVARIVICELLNAFPSRVFPNPLEMHSHLQFGIRPLLYSILRREFLSHHDTGICANTHCRDFFEIERAGQHYCKPECSRQHRQREYWQEEGKKRRKRRLAKAKREERMRRQRSKEN